MLLLTPDQAVTLKDWFLPERPGPLIGLHVLQTGHGVFYADRWPQPRAILVDTASNMSLAGDPSGLQPDDLRAHVAGFVEAPAPFVPVLRATHPDLVAWERIIFALVDKPRYPLPNDYLVRRLTIDDAHALGELSPNSRWIYKTWGTPVAMPASGYAWGAFADNQLVAIANIFFLGQQYEDIGVVTEPGFRGLGLSVACAGALCEDIQVRGHIPSWSTSLDNLASQRVAEKLGFAFQRYDYIYVIGSDLPGE